jgi:hypothetical protein
MTGRVPEPATTETATELRSLRPSWFGGEERAVDDDRDDTVIAPAQGCQG